ncbi:hypothetical protein EMIT0P74_10324 [Pseudomonas sp. IT-P74]
MRVDIPDQYPEHPSPSFRDLKLPATLTSIPKIRDATCRPYPLPTIQDLRKPARPRSRHSRAF